MTMLAFYQYTDDDKNFFQEDYYNEITSKTKISKIDDDGNDEEQDNKYNN
jgi:hypothetical protein